MPAIMQSCATVFSGSREDITINSNIEGAKVILANRSHFETPVGTTPCSVRAKRTTMYVTFKKNGYKDATVKLRRGVNPMLFVNIPCLTFFTGAIIDFADGAYLHLPKTVYAEMMANNETKSEPNSQPSINNTQPTNLTFKIGDNVSFKNDKGEYYDGKIIGLNPTTALVQYKTTTGQIIQTEVELNKLFRLQ